MVRKLRRSEFTLEDYRDQLAQVRKMGPLDQVLAMIPGLGIGGRRTWTRRRASARCGARWPSSTP